MGGTAIYTNTLFSIDPKKIKRRKKSYRKTNKDRQIGKPNEYCVNNIKKDRNTVGGHNQMPRCGL